MQDSESWREGKPSEEPQGPRNNRVVSSLDFCFSLYMRIPHLKLKVPEIQKCQQTQICFLKGGSNKSMLSLDKGPSKKQHIKTNEKNI